MRPPKFWNRADGLNAGIVARTFLTPLSWIYQAGAAARAGAATPYAPDAPVICVGNVTLGGSGKTPVTLAVLRRLARKGVIAHALSRGYGGSALGPLLVDAERHEADVVGDEALLLARRAPTWVAKSKADGVRAAARAGAQAIVLDDGFQNPTVVKDASLVLVDAAFGFGNGHVFPAGPLREPPRAALNRADAIVIVAGSQGVDKDAPWRAHVPDRTPILTAKITPTAPLPPGPVYAFAGIARPEKFFHALAGAGAEVKATKAYPDHHPFSEADIQELRAAARRHNALLLTTEKDQARLPRDMRRIVQAWPVEATFDDNTVLDRLIERAIDRAAGR